MTKPRPLAVIRNRRLNSVALLDPLRSVQFSSVWSIYVFVTLDARGCLAWLGLLWVLFYFFDHYIMRVKVQAYYIQSSVQYEYSTV